MYGYELEFENTNHGVGGKERVSCVASILTWNIQTLDYKIFNGCEVKIEKFHQEIICSALPGLPRKREKIITAI